MSAKLVVYEYVPSGFEMVIGKKEICPGSSGGVWNLWWNVTLTDDPEAWDTAIRRINKMQDELNELTGDQRLIRAQMAEFCRLNPLFPQSIDILCREIGTGRFAKPLRMGCEGRGLVTSLGFNDPPRLNAQRKETLLSYTRALKKWLGHNHPDNSIESKVSGFLGQPTDAKKTFVKQLRVVIDPTEPAISSLKNLVEDACRKTQTKFDTLRFRPFNCLQCNGSAAPIPTCQCCYSMILDAGLLCVGTFDEERSMSEESSRFIEENILAYSTAINSWLTEEPPKLVISLTKLRYITQENAVEIAERAHSSLGEKDDVTEWLTACLLKTITGNQRWHKRTELIDDLPEATSWLKERR